MPSGVCVRTHISKWCTHMSVHVCLCVVVFTAFLVVVHALTTSALGYSYLFCGMCVSRPYHPKSGKKKNRNRRQPSHRQQQQQQKARIPWIRAAKESALVIISTVRGRVTRESAPPERKAVRERECL